MKLSHFYRLALCALCGATLVALLPASPSQAQQRWERTFGGAVQDYGYDVRQTSDGGYVVAGMTNSFGAGSYDVYLIKTNASGDTLWTRTYGGADYDYALSIQLSSDTGYIISGGTYSFGGGGDDVYLLKTNASGDTLWTRTYGGASHDYGSSVRQTSDGGYIIAGTTFSYGSGSGDVYLLKTNATGDTLWTRTYGGTNEENGISVQQTSDSGYVIAGFTCSFGAGSYDAYLIKTNASGDTLWTKTYGGTGLDVGYSVQQTTDGGFIIAGSTNSFGNGDQVYLIKTNASGDTLWTKTYGGTSLDYGQSVQQTSGGGYIIAGATWSSGDSSQTYLIKTNASGDTLWTRTYGGANPDLARSVYQTSDGGYIVAGQTRSFGDSDQVYLIKTDANGSSGVEESRQGDKETRRQGERLRATPNPYTSFATVPGHEAERFSLYDVSGRRVGIFRGDRVGEGLAPGVYFVRGQSSTSTPLRIVKIR